MGRGDLTKRGRLRILGLLWLTFAAVGCGSPAAPLPAIDLSSATVPPSPGTWFDYEAADAGTVRFSVVGDTLRLDSVRRNEGWRWRPDRDDTDDDVAIDFHHEGESRKVDFEADIHDGLLLVEVETAFPAHDRILEWGADTAGDVLIVVSDQRVSLDRITTKDGWTWTQSDHDPVSIEFVNREGDLVEFDARTDDGTLEVEVESRWRPILDDALE